MSSLIFLAASQAGRLHYMLATFIMGQKRKRNIYIPKKYMHSAVHAVTDFLALSQAEGRNITALHAVIDFLAPSHPGRLHYMLATFIMSQKEQIIYVPKTSICRAQYMSLLIFLPPSPFPPSLRGAQKNQQRHILRSDCSFLAHHESGEHAV